MGSNYGSLKKAVAEHRGPLERPVFIEEAVTILRFAGVFSRCFRIELDSETESVGDCDRPSAGDATVTIEGDSAISADGLSNSLEWFCDLVDHVVSQ